MIGTFLNLFSSHDIFRVVKSTRWIGGTFSMRGA